MTAPSDAETLRAIRAAHAAIAPADWRLAQGPHDDGDGLFAEARGPMGELWPVCSFHPGASAAERDFCVAAPAWVGFLLALLDRSFAAIRELRAAAEGRAPDRAPSGQDAPAQGQRPAGRGAARERDYAAEAAMKCAEPAFRVFLEECHGLERPLTEEKVAQRVRSLCGVSSRRALNEGGRAAEAWRALVRDFEAWRKRG